MAEVKTARCYRCPACGGDNLDVSVSAWARLIQYSDAGEAVFETDVTEAENGDHEWDGDSEMVCRSCAHFGNADAFTTTEVDD